MENEDRIRCSKLVADFMGYKLRHELAYQIPDKIMYDGTDEAVDIWLFNELKFHNNMDWLYPVWVKFRDITFNQRETECSKNEHWHSKAKEDIGRAILYGTIEEAFLKLAYFIEIYNKIK
jgi:hypothetical protein